jgi:hypothetical protein
MSEASVLRGAAALVEMLGMIGRADGPCRDADRAFAQVFVDNELNLRALLAFTMSHLAAP